MAMPLLAVHLPLRGVFTAVAAPIEAVHPPLVICQRQWYYVLHQIWLTAETGK